MLHSSAHRDAAHQAARRLLVLVNRRLLCNCESRTVIIITFGLSSAATSMREHACRRRRRRAFERRSKITRQLFISRRNSCDVREEERKFIRDVLCRSFIIGLKSEGEFLDILEPGLSLADRNIKESRIEFVTIILYFAMIRVNINRILLNGVI